MFTLDEAKRMKGQAVPVRLSARQKAHTQSLADAWTRSLIAQARDDSDPEMRDNARTILDFRGIAW